MIDYALKMMIIHKNVTFFALNTNIHEFTLINDNSEVYHIIWSCF